METNVYKGHDAYQQATQPECIPLAHMIPGQKARIVGLSDACQGVERRRLLDLGFVPHTDVAVEMVSPSGDPTAYRVRGAHIALRREQASLIYVSPHN